MIYNVPGISTARYMFRDYYVAIACEICGVSPLDIMDSHKSSHRVSTARRAVIYALYCDGGISAAKAGEMLGVKACVANDAISHVAHQLRMPCQYPLVTAAINAIQNREGLHS